MSLIAVIDFETTGLSPTMGDRATEIAIVLVESGQVVDRFQSLMNVGKHIPSFIETLTGISNAMLSLAPSAQSVMRDASRFVGSVPLAAHNAAFDRRFWQAEMDQAGEPSSQAFACTLLLSRRLYPHSPDHKLGTLVAFHKLPKAARAHRALADAEMAAALLIRIQFDLRSLHGVKQPNHSLLMSVQRCTKFGLPALFAKHTVRH